MLDFELNYVSVYLATADSNRNSSSSYYVASLANQILIENRY